jgi:RHS repeat-associated protein
VRIGWISQWRLLGHADLDPLFWHGTLLQDKRTETRTFYRRNRYYDPATGQFTQEDPIGLAGGLNLYGFAGGDPVNFSDPFGLCPEHITGVPCIPEAGSQGIESVGTGPWDWVSPRAAIGMVRGAGKAAVRRAIASEAGEAIATGFARWSFRRNLTREIGEVAGAEAHHIFPYALRGDFGRIGIDVNRPRFGAWWEKAGHRANAFRYNQAWRTFFRENPNATRDQALDYGRELGRRYGFETRF